MPHLIAYNISSPNPVREPAGVAAARRRGALRQQRNGGASDNEAQGDEGDAVSPSKRRGSADGGDGAGAGESGGGSGSGSGSGGVANGSPQPATPGRAPVPSPRSKNVRVKFVDMESDVVRVPVVSPAVPSCSPMLNVLCWVGR